MRTGPHPIDTQTACSNSYGPAQAPWIRQDLGVASSNSLYLGGSEDTPGPEDPGISWQIVSIYLAASRAPRYRDSSVALRFRSWTLKKSAWRRLPPQMAILFGCVLGLAWCQCSSVSVGVSSYRSLGAWRWACLVLTVTVKLSDRAR